MSTWKKLPEGELRELYVGQGLTTKEIAVRVGTRPANVCRWLSGYGIPARPPAKQPVPDWAPSSDELRCMVHEQHRPYRSIAADYGVSGPVVEGWLDKYKIPRAPRNRPLTKGKPTAAELSDLYVAQRLGTRTIGERYGVRHITVRRWLDEYGVPIRPVGPGYASGDVVTPTRDELHDLVHVQHLGYREIAKRYGVSYTLIPSWLDTHGITKPTAWKTRRRGIEVTIPPSDRLAAEYAAGASMAALGRRYGVSGGMVSGWLRDAGVEVRPDGWQGGRRWACADGHEVRSSYEQRVDDWLTAHGLEHDTEPALPCDRRYRADFLVEGTYVEVWGVVNSPSYDERRQKKTALYREHGLPLIELPVWTFGRGAWARRLAKLLPDGALRG